MEVCWNCAWMINTDCYWKQTQSKSNSCHFQVQICNTFYNFSILAIDVGDGSWHALSVKLRGGRLDIDLDGYTILWLEGALVRKIGLKMTAFRLLGGGCYRSATVDLKSSMVIQGEVVKDKCDYKDR